MTTKKTTKRTDPTVGTVHGREEANEETAADGFWERVANTPGNTEEEEWSRLFLLSWLTAPPIDLNVEPEYINLFKPVRSVLRDDNGELLRDDRGRPLRGGEAKFHRDPEAAGVVGFIQDRDDDKYLAAVLTSGKVLRYDDTTDEEWADVLANWPEMKKRLEWAKALPDWPEATKEPKRQSGKVKLTPVSEIKVRAVTWLWKNRIPSGTLSVLTGPGDVGKSTLAIKWAADLTRGRMVGIYKGQPKSVIIVASEDTFEDTIKPRLMAAEADLDRVFRGDKTDEYRSIVVPDDIPALEELIRENDVALVILDPLLPRIGNKLDTHKDADVRRALEPLKKMAGRTGAVVLGFVHFNKGTSTDAIGRVMASGALTHVPRSVFALVQDNDVRVLGHVKKNLGVKQPDLAYKIETVYLGDDDNGQPITAGKMVQLDGEPAQSMQEIMDAAGTSRRPKRQDVAEWLRDYLDEHGETPSADVKRLALHLGLAGSEKTVTRAADEIGVVREYRTNDKGRYAVWSLPKVNLDDHEDLLGGLTG